MKAKKSTYGTYNQAKFVAALKKPTTAKELAKTFKVTTTAIWGWLTKTQDNGTKVYVQQVRRGKRGPLSYAYSTIPKTGKITYTTTQAY